MASAQAEVGGVTNEPHWWWQFHWDCLIYGSLLMKQEAEAEEVTHAREEAA